MTTDGPDRGMDDLAHDESAGASRGVEGLRLGDEAARAEPFGVLLDEFPEKGLLRELALHGVDLRPGRR